MKNMKVSVKLIVSFMIVVALTIVVGIVGIVGMVGINIGSINIYESQAQPLSDFGMAREYFQRLRVSLRDVVINSGDLNELEVLEGQIFSNAQYFLSYMEQYRATLETQEHIDIYYQIIAAFDEFQRSMPWIMASAKADAPHIQMILMMDEMIEPTYFIMDALSYLTYVRVIEAENVHRFNNFQFTIFFVVIIAVIAASVAVMLYLVKYLSEHISKPIVTIGKFANKVSLGEIKIADVAKFSIDIESEDEVGELARMLEQSYIQLNEFERSKYEAESASQAKSDFLSKMSHEIRTPMNAVLGMTELILHENITDTIRSQAETIKYSGNHLLSIINDILDFSKIESGKLEVSEHEYLFHSAVYDVVNIIKMRMNKPDVSFYVYMQHDIPNTLIGDEVRIKQILINILDNAYKYTSDGFFSLEISGRKIDKDSFVLTMSIKDTGLGIKPDDLEKLFEKFERFDVDKNRYVEGAGLGLTVTQNLISLMDGQIGATSEYEKGSEFTITLPQKAVGIAYEPPSFENTRILIYCTNPANRNYITRALDDLKVRYRTAMGDKEFSSKLIMDSWDYIFVDAELAQSSAQIMEGHGSEAKIVKIAESYDTTGATGTGKEVTLVMPVYLLSIVNILTGQDVTHASNGKDIEYFVAPDAKVLIVDDIDTNLKVGEGLLKQYGVNVTLCSSGKDSIKAVKSDDYDLVFMDHMMPGMDGIEAVRRIRDLAGLMGDKYNQLPIVALTANAVVGTKEMFLKNGFDDFLSKPIDTAKLNKILLKWLPKDKQKLVDPATVSEQQEVTLEIPGVDTKQGISHTGGTLQSYMYILKIFHMDGVKKLDELNTCIDNDNISLYTIHVHALATACANIGAANLSKEAKALEMAGKKQDSDFIKEYNDGFITRMKQLLEDVAAVLHTDSDEDDLDTAQLKEQLAELKTALDDYNIRTVKATAKGLKGFTTYPSVGDDISEILRNILMSEYEQAAEQVGRLMGRL